MKRKTRKKGGKGREKEEEEERKRRGRGNSRSRWRRVTVLSFSCVSGGIGEASETMIITLSGMGETDGRLHKGFS